MDQIYHLAGIVCDWRDKGVLWRGKRWELRRGKGSKPTTECPRSLQKHPFLWTILLVNFPRHYGHRRNGFPINDDDQLDRLGLRLLRKGNRGNFKNLHNQKCNVGAGCSFMARWSSVLLEYICAKVPELGSWGITSIIGMVIINFRLKFNFII